MCDVQDSEYILEVSFEHDHLHSHLVNTCTEDLSLSSLSSSTSHLVSHKSTLFSSFSLLSSPSSSFSQHNLEQFKQSVGEVGRSEGRVWSVGLHDKPGISHPRQACPQSCPSIHPPPSPSSKSIASFTRGNPVIHKAIDQY